MHKDELEYLYCEYEHDLANMNNFSYWFEFVDACGIAVPRTSIIPVPFNVYSIIEGDRLDEKCSHEPVVDFVYDCVIPAFNELTAGKPPICFCKNGTYSGKYDASRCFTNEYRMLESFIDICYEAACVGARGNTEFVLREIIPYDRQHTATIYNGLPLRPEFRVFYDFDSHTILYMVEYWNFDYVYPNLHTFTDRIIFQNQKDRMQKRVRRKIQICLR